MTDITDKFVDKNFLAEIRSELKKGDSDPIYEEDVNSIKNLYLSDRNIKDLAGIEYFTALVKLDVSYNMLTKLDLSKNTELVYLYAGYNQLSKLNVSKNTKLEILMLYQNCLKSLNARPLKKLTFLNVALNYMSGKVKVMGYFTKNRIHGRFVPQHAVDFIAAIKVYDLPQTATIGVPLTLSGTVFPSEATNKTIKNWRTSAPYTTKAKINDNVFIPQSAGEICICGSVENGEAEGKDFEFSFKIAVKDPEEIARRKVLDKLERLRFSTMIKKKAEGRSIADKMGRWG